MILRKLHNEPYKEWKLEKYKHQKLEDMAYNLSDVLCVVLFDALNNSLKSRSYKRNEIQEFRNNVLNLIKKNTSLNIY